MKWGKPLLLVPGNFSMFLKHFTLVEHLFTPGEAHENISCIFFLQWGFFSFFRWEKPPILDFCGQGFVQPRSLTETGLRINPNKRIKLGGGVRRDVGIALSGKVFWFSLCFDVRGPDLQLLCSPGRWVWGKNENSALRKQIKMSDQCLHCIYLK